MTAKEGLLALAVGVSYVPGASGNNRRGGQPGSGSFRHGLAGFGLAAAVQQAAHFNNIFAVLVFERVQSLGDPRLLDRPLVLEQSRLAHTRELAAGEFEQADRRDAVPAQEFLDRVNLLWDFKK